MEALIMGWYILSATNSVVMLTLVGAFRFLGTLLSPWFGVAGDRFGRRAMMLCMRGALMALAAIIMILALLDLLVPWPPSHGFRGLLRQVAMLSFQRIVP